MTTPRPFRFGGSAPITPTGAGFAEHARHIEALGYATFLMADHFSPNWFAAGPALTAAALATTTLRVGCTVYANDFRHHVARPPMAGQTSPATSLAPPARLVGREREQIARRRRGMRSSSWGAATTSRRRRPTAPEKSARPRPAGRRHVRSAGYHRGRRRQPGRPLRPGARLSHTHDPCRSSLSYHKPES